MKFCMVGGLQMIVLRFEFHQNRLSGFGAVGGRSLPIPIDLAVGLYNSLYYRTSRDTTLIFRPHRSTTYVDAAYSYRPSSSVVCRSVTLVSPAKTAAPIELPFGLRTWVGPGNHVLDGGPDPPMGKGKFLGENGRPIVKYRDTLRSSVQRRLNR